MTVGAVQVEGISGVALGTEATLQAILAASGGGALPLNTGFANSFRTLGNAATPQNLLTIENPAGNDRIVHVRSVHLTMDVTAVLVAVVPYFRISRPAALPTGGTVLTKTQSDTTQTADASIVVRGATASDGGAATAITATAGASIRQSFAKRLHTAVGEVLGQTRIVLLDDDDAPVILQPNEALLLQLVAAAAASNAATNHYLCCIAWEEF